MPYFFKWDYFAELERYERNIVQAPTKDKAIEKLWPDHSFYNRYFLDFHSIYVFGPYATMEIAQKIKLELIAI